MGRVAGFFANDRSTSPPLAVSSSLSNPHSLLFGPNHATHYELRTDWIIWSSCMHQPNSERRRRSKKGQAKPMDHEYLPSSLLCLLCAYLTLCSAAAYYDDGEKGLWKQSNRRRGCLLLSRKVSSDYRQKQRASPSPVTVALRSVKARTGHNTGRQTE